MALTLSWHKKNITVIPKDITVVGYNLYAANIIWLLAQSKQYKINWLAHVNDYQKLSKCPDWVYIPEARMVTFDIDDAFIVNPNRIAFYVDQSKRIPFHRFLFEKNFHFSRSETFPHCIREKVFATALWNDLTPPLWLGGEPNNSWPNIAPMSRSVWQKDWKGALLCSKQTALQAAEKTLQHFGIEAPDSNRVVTGLESGKLGDHDHLLFNAPHPPFPSSCTLWCTPYDSSSGIHQPVVARWINYTSVVDLKYISPLPLISIWLHSDHNTQLLETGLISAGSISRVFVIPKNSQEAYLQIQNLEFLPIRSHIQVPRPDSFLWNLCPYLKGSKLSFTQSMNDEDIIYEKPTESIKKIFKGSYSYWPGTFSKNQLLKKVMRYRPPEEHKI